jgi:hypothetical protein
MTRLEKAQLLKEKGYTYNPETGKVYGSSGKEIIRKNKNGYIIIGDRNISGNLLGHHYAWFITYGNVDFIELDHKDINPSNNKIHNLRISNRFQQTQNRNCKGYGFHKRDKKWQAQIRFNKKYIHLGYFNTEEEARQAYLEAKKKYHTL